MYSASFFLDPEVANWAKKQDVKVLHLLVIRVKPDRRTVTNTSKKRQFLLWSASYRFQTKSWTEAPPPQNRGSLLWHDMIIDVDGSISSKNEGRD